MFSCKKGYKIRAKVHGKGGIFSTRRLAYVPLLDWIAVTGIMDRPYIMVIQLFLNKGQVLSCGQLIFF